MEALRTRIDQMNRLITKPVAADPEVIQAASTLPSRSRAPASQAAGQVFNVATGTRVDLNETFQVLKKIIGYKGEVKYEAERAGDVKHSLAGLSRAEKHLGYRPKMTFEAGLRRTVEWYRGRQQAANA